jgi:hypothetical protein
MQMGMVLAITSMGVEDRNIAPSERLAPDFTIEIVQALRPAAHQRAQRHGCVLVEGGAEHRRHRQDDVAIEHPLMEDLAYLGDPVIDVDLGTP